MSERFRYYYLVGTQAVGTDDVVRWAQQIERTDRRVAEDTVGDLWVSTVFFGHRSRLRAWRQSAPFRKNGVWPNVGRARISEVFNVAGSDAGTPGDVQEITGFDDSNEAIFRTLRKLAQSAESMDALYCGVAMGKLMRLEQEVERLQGFLTQQSV